MRWFQGIKVESGELKGKCGTESYQFEYGGRQHKRNIFFFGNGKAEGGERGGEGSSHKMLIYVDLK